MRYIVRGNSDIKKRATCRLTRGNGNKKKSLVRFGIKIFPIRHSHAMNCEMTLS